MASFIISALFLATIFTLQSNSVLAQWDVDSESSSYNLFAGDLLSVIAAQESDKNVVYSPFSINSILALIYMGAGGSTEIELRKVLKLDQNQEKNDFALNYRNVLETTFNEAVPENEYYAPPQLSMANHIYVSKLFKISEQFNKTAVDNFKSGIENVDFNDPSAVVQQINRWVEEQTSNKIKDLIKPGVIDERTNMVLVNALYLDAKWFTSFNPDNTKKLNFHLNRNEIVNVDTMYNEAFYPYAALPELNAQAVELKLKNSDISMLIILPNEIDGLEEVEEKLKGKDLNKVVPNMNEEYLRLYFPKFRIEYEIDLEEPLKQMGASSMFGDNANLTGIFDSDISQQVSNVVHKVYLDCNEIGLEAAGGTYAGFMYKFNMAVKVNFRVDHPFFFAIRNKNAVFFAGHVAKFE